MVHREQQHVLVAALGQQPGARQRAVREVEGSLGFGRAAGHHPGVESAIALAPVVVGEGDAQLVPDDLQRVAVLVEFEAGAQRLVAHGDLVEDARQQRRVQPTADANRVVIVHQGHANTLEAGVGSTFSFTLPAAHER